MTTKRIRNHELEELSLAALRFALPPKWVIHDFRKDYGIDVQLEIFESDGFATGLRCYGQLKATDNSTDEDVLSLDRDHFEYWGAHTDPVLLLRYYADSERYFWCWLHDVAWSLKPDAQSLNVTKFLRPWDKGTSPKNIQDFLGSRSRAFTARQLPPFLVSVRGRSTPMATLAEVANSSDDLASSSAFQFESDSLNPAVFEVNLLPGGVVCSYLGLPGVMVEEMGEAPPDSIAGTILLLVFLTACRYDRILAARPLVKSCFGVMIKAAGDKYFFPLIDSVVYAVGLKEAAKLFHDAIESDIPAAGHVLFPGVAYVAAQRYGEAEQWIAMLREELAESTVDAHRAATAYSLGNALSHRNLWKEALPMFRLAAVALPEYFNRAYFRHEYGAAYFENGLFEEAAEQYRAALGLEPSARLHYLLGDVLFSAGKFSDAITELNIALSSELADVDQTTALLLKVLCSEMVDVWGFSQLEHAKPDGGGIEVLQGFTSEELKSLPKTLRQLMRIYGSDALFNFNAGHLANTNSHRVLAAYRYLHSAMRQRGDSEAWALAVGCAIAAKDSLLMSLGIVVGYFYVKERLLIDFFKVSQFAGASDTQKNELQRMIAEIVHGGASRPEVNPFTLRFFGPEQTNVFQVPR